MNLNGGCCNRVKRLAQPRIIRVRGPSSSSSSSSNSASNNGDHHRTRNKDFGFRYDTGISKLNELTSLQPSYHAQILKSPHPLSSFVFRGTYFNYSHFIVSHLLCLFNVFHHIQISLVDLSVENVVRLHHTKFYKRFNFG